MFSVLVIHTAHRMSRRIRMTIAHELKSYLLYIAGHT
jgi:hypothetical protein